MTSLRLIVGALDQAGAGPLHQQLARGLRRAIDLRRLAAEEVLPPERDIAEEFGVSRFTVRRALKTLAAEGRLVRRQGSGTVIAPPAAGRIEASFSRLVSLSEEMLASGRASHSVWLGRAPGSATPEEAAALEIAPGAAIHRLDRIRHIEGAPLIVEFTTLPGFCLEDARRVQGSLYGALESRGFRPARAEQRLRAVALHGDQADQLGVCDGAGGLFVERRARLADGRPVEFTRAYFRGDAFDFVAHLTGPRPPHRLARPFLADYSKEALA